MATRHPVTGVPEAPDAAPHAAPSPAAPVASRRPGTGAVSLDDMLAVADPEAWDASAPTEAIPLPPPDGDAPTHGKDGTDRFDESAPTETLALPPSREGGKR